MQTPSKNILARDFEWLCNMCNNDIFPCASLETSEFIDFFSEKVQNNQPVPNKKSKCGICIKKVQNKKSFIYCPKCANFYHLQCNRVPKNNFPLPTDWHCNICTLHSLPFSSLTDDNCLLMLQGFSTDSANKLSNLPSFSIQSLLDSMPGQNFSSDEFLSDSIESNILFTCSIYCRNFFKKSKANR